MRRATVGHGLLYFNALVAILGAVVADWNRTHLFNPAWPPHARFHDAQTISLGALLGLTGLVLLRAGRHGSRLHLGLAAWLPAMFFLAQAMSFGFPTTGGLNAEFPERVPNIGPFYLNELPFSLAMLIIAALGFWLACPERHR